MKPHERQDLLDEASAILSCLQSFLCEANRDHVTLEADGLYVLLGCVLTRLKDART